jgi:hypothetical protein
MEMTLPPVCATVSRHVRTSLRFMAVAFVLLVVAAPASAQTVASQFAEHYTLSDLGSVAEVPTPYGGLFILPDRPNTLYLAGSANQQAGALYAVPIARDGNGRITGFAGSAARVADAPYNDGGIVRDPGGLISYAEWPVNGYAQIDLASGLVINRIDLTPFEVASSAAGVGFIPAGYPGAGGMRIVSWPGGEYYEVSHEVGGNGKILVRSVSPVPGSQLPGGPEGWAYVPLGSPQFAVPSMIVSEYSAGNVAVYEMDGAGNPVIASRRLFIEGLVGAEGAAIDPVSGAFLFSTFGVSDRVLVANGFTPPAPVPALSLTATSLDFGDQTLETSSAAQTVTARNTGSAPLEISAIAIAGDFGFTGCATPITLSPDGSCTLSITFFPTATGARTGSVSIESNAPDTPHGISLTGTGTPAPVPGIALAPASADFGAVVAGTTTSKALALGNTGTAPLQIGSIAVTGTFFTGSQDCPASLAPSAACTITVTYAPASPGTHAGELRILSNAVPSPMVAPLSGSATSGTVAGLQLSAGLVTFAPQFLGTTSAAQSVTLTSSGTAPLVISGVASTGDFAFSGCGPATLAPGASCTFSITFRPFTEGAQSGAIVISSNAPGSPHTLSLSGTGAPLAGPVINLAPAAFDFGALRTQRSATLVGRLTNTGAAPLAISQIASSGAFFSQSNNCPGTLAVAAFCDVTVSYGPTETGAHSGQLVIHSNAIPSPHIAALSGTGITVPPPFLAVEAAVAFGQHVTGTTVRRTLTLANTGGEPLQISQLALIGSGAFGLEGGCTTVAPESSCDLTLSFTPGGLGAFNARLDIVSNHSGGVVQVALSGVGTAVPRAALELSVGAIGFGNQGVGTPSAERGLRITSVGGIAAEIGSIGASLPDFIVSTNCPALLAPQQGCDVGVVFRPMASGARQGVLMIQSNAAGESPHAVSLTGVGCRFFSLGGSRNPLRMCSP